MPTNSPNNSPATRLDAALIESGWAIQDKKKINLSSTLGIDVGEFQADPGSADYILFVEKKPVGVIEAKRPEEGHHLTSHEGQTEEYAAAKLKYLNNEKLSFALDTAK